MGLVIASINSVIVGIIGLHTNQYGLILANLFCILAYAWNLQDWRHDRKPALATPAPPVASPAQSRPQPGTRASLPSQKVHGGLFLAYSDSSHARAKHTANSLMNADATAGANTGN